MDDNDPYTPVEVKRSLEPHSDRPYYIYATSIVLLLWAGVFVYLQFNYELSEDGGVIYLSLRTNSAIHSIGVEISVVVIAIAASVLAVNALLWCVRKFIGSSGITSDERT